ncbi:MAG: hypothetical protein LBV13_01490 [Methanomassiliicoccaceae archaeon]|jgi:ribonuclease-3|nr:hypothetical protein [Methanomassiliicoccaceae archaeon]
MALQRIREMRLREFLASPPFGRRDVPDDELELFNEALTHDSYANEEASRNRAARSYERLEFLGDAVIQMTVCEHIYSDTELSEGEMTDFKKDAVCNRNIASKVKDAGIDIDGTLLVGEGHRKRRTGENVIEDNMRADAFEAVIGAVYIIHGMDEARRIVKEVLLHR